MELIQEYGFVSAIVVLVGGVGAAMLVTKKRNKKK